MGIKVIILDMDGVIYLGDRLIAGADKAIAELKKRSIRIAYLTNACTKSRKGRADKLRTLGIPVEDSEVFTTSDAVANYIATHYSKSKQKVFPVGGNGLNEELENKGISIVDSDQAEIVVVGLDLKMTYEKMAKAFRAILRGADFIATNDDRSFPVEDGLLPGAGTLVEFLAFGTGKRPFIIGKPNTYMLETLVHEFGVKKSEMLIVGDRIETDIALGKKFGIKSVLVLSGVAKKQDLKKLKNSEIPDYVINSISDIFDLDCF